MALEKLKALESKYPWMSDEVIVVVDGIPITLRRAIEEIEKGTEFGRRISQELRRLGYDPVYQLTEEQWELAYARWSQYPPNMTIYWKNRVWTVKDILNEIRRRTPIGSEFAAMELGLLEKAFGGEI